MRLRRSTSLQKKNKTQLQKYKITRSYKKKNIEWAVRSDDFNLAQKVIEKQGIGCFTENDSEILRLAIELKRTNLLTKLLNGFPDFQVEMIKSFLAATLDMKLSPKQFHQWIWSLCSESPYKVLENIILSPMKESFVKEAVKIFLLLWQKKIFSRELISESAVMSDNVMLVKHLITSINASHDWAASLLEHAKSVEMVKIICEQFPAAYTYNDSYGKTMFNNRLRAGRYDLASAMATLSERFTCLIRSTRHSQNSEFYSFSVRRNHVIEDAFRAIKNHSPEKYKASPSFAVGFEKEIHPEGGGPLNEFISLFLKELVLGNEEENVKPYFEVVDEESNYYAPTNDHSEEEFKFVGYIVATALLRGAALGVQLIPHIYERLCCLNDPKEETLKLQHPSIFKSLQSLRNEDIDFESLELYLDKKETIPVNKANVEDYIAKIVNEKLYYKYFSKINSFVEGFNITLREETGNYLTPLELAQILEGEPECSAQEFLEKVEFNDSENMYSNFKRMIMEFTAAERNQFISFITGHGRLPFGGLSRLQFKMHIHVHSAMKPDSLPRVATCSRTMTMPKYPNYNIMREKILKAIYYGFNY